MPIEIYTGKPGNGKTALMMERLMAAAKAADRPIFAGGIDGLQPGLATVLKDPKEWNAIRPGHVCRCHDTEDDSGCDAHVVPNGSLIFIDEAWKWFGHLHDASRQATPAHVLGLAEHRHRGIDMVWTSQGPNQIYPFARPLIADHFHTVRKFGTTIIEVFHWQELQEDVKSQAKRELAQATTRTIPASTYGAYKSAEVHTIKRKIPLKVLALPLLAVLAIACGWFGYARLKPSTFAGTLGADQTHRTEPGLPGPATADESASAAAKDVRPQPKWKNLTEYAQDHLPRFGTAPWTAVIYDERGVTADPQVFCMASRAGLDADGQHSEGGCHCITEQATVYELDEAQCRRVARLGMPYNPYKQPNQQRQDVPAQAVQQPPQGGAAVGAGSVITGKQMATYGDIGVAPKQVVYSSM
ncbi:zonular occludens toxin domain-containing protein [Pseudoxanthomonas sp.]|uniref:zonular occludens toxin domain-containing protein n=1 Tax=Pseudoxanthomonas sp. TaxID=1871049 RepID=UPI00261D9242|nr:zonular occludens toxin domain-containing protein [Pseudoxanthomonas sp.]WDS36967.1 MAG: zonular occludens toxin domain-containing protein [Pseudoxanthomonas sp.]